jgi:hypothetical protein
MLAIGALIGTLFRGRRTKESTKANPSLIAQLGSVINSMAMPESQKDESQLGRAIADYVQFINDASTYQRADNYKLYAKMDDTDPIVFSVLNIYADEIAMGTHEGDVTKTFTITSDNPGVLDFLNQVTDRLALKYRIKGMARDLVKFGDFFDEILFTENHLAHKLVNLPPQTMHVNVDQYGELIDRDTRAYLQRMDGLRMEDVEFPWWKISHAHWTLSPRDVYGTSLLRPVRKLYHQLRAVTDGVVIERVLRAPQRLKFLVDTGDMAADKAVEITNRYRDTNRRKRVMDASGVFRVENTPMAPEEDIYIPTGPNGRGDVSVIEGSSQTKNVEDLQFLINMYISAMGVPKAYLAFEGESHNRNVITQLDIHHARLVRAYQGELIQVLRGIYDVCLAAIGIPKEFANYRIVFPFIRTEDDLRKWQIINLKIRVGYMLRTQVGVRITDEWIMKYLLDIPEDELEYIGYDPNNVNSPMMAMSGAAPGSSMPGEAGEYIKALVQQSKDKELKEMITNLAELVDAKAKRDTNGTYTVPAFRKSPDGSAGAAKTNMSRICDFMESD